VIGDRDLLEFRRGYYDLLARLLGAEPPATLLDQLRAGLPARRRAARELHAALGEGWAIVDQYLARHGAGAAAAAADEFTRLFVGPGVPPLHPYESYYLTGRLLDRPLATLRGFLRSIGIEKEPDHPEPEDWLAFELSVMVRLIDRQREARDSDTATRWMGGQARLLREHLLVWAPACAADLAAAAGAELYRGVGRLLQGLLEIELDLVRDWDATPVPSLDEARAAVADTGAWRGPLFDLPAGPPPEGAPAPGPGPTTPPDLAPPAASSLPVISRLTAGWLLP
jgi:TorA maturation chaperone TorD